MKDLELNAHLLMSGKGINIFSTERVTQNLKWPTDQWSLLLQSVLNGKAQEAYHIRLCRFRNVWTMAMIKCYFKSMCQ